MQGSGAAMRSTAPGAQGAHVQQGGASWAAAHATAARPAQPVPLPPPNHGCPNPHAQQYALVKHVNAPDCTM